jgi:flagellar basal body P-ring formation protein FlgA
MAGALALAAFAMNAAGAQSLETRIERAARDELMEQARQAELVDPTIHVEVRSRADKPARPCSKDIEVEPTDTRFMTRMRFAAICPGTPAWRVEYAVRGAIEADIVVATSTIDAGEPIRADQLERVKRDASETPGALSDIDAVVGKSSQRPLRRGQPINSRWLTEPVMVKRGATVSIVARNTGISAEVPGEAMDDGARDAIVRVRNNLNGKIIRTRVIADDTVEPVDLPAAP